jgi:hypothetical protein
MKTIQDSFDHSIRENHKGQARKDARRRMTRSIEMERAIAVE